VEFLLSFDIGQLPAAAAAAGRNKSTLFSQMEAVKAITTDKLFLTSAIC
jgi:hypothetical protein